MPAALTPRNSSSAQQLPSPFPCGPRAACFVLRHRRGRPRELARLLHPLAPVLPVRETPSRGRHKQPHARGNREARDSRPPSAHPALSGHAPSAAHAAPTVAHTARSRPNPPRTPRARAAAFARTEHVTHLPVRRRPTSRPPRRRAGFPRASARLPSFTMALLTRVQGRGALHLLSRLPRSHGALQTPHGPHRPRRSRPSLRNAACTPASAHRSTARKSPVLPESRTGREASEASTAARSAADSLK